MTEFNLADAVRLWVDDFQPLAASHGVGIKLNAQGDLSFRTDYYKVERICYNLISNALKYNREGGTVTVSVIPLEGKVEITVADTGVGMSKEVLSRVFDKFYRAHGGGSGTGVGLAVVKAFTELLGGRVSAESVEEKAPSSRWNYPVCPRTWLPRKTKKDQLPATRKLGRRKRATIKKVCPLPRHGQAW